MKLTLVILAWSFSLAAAIGQPSRHAAESPEHSSVKRPDVGILDVYDNQIAFNHNQAFKRYLHEQQLKKGKHPTHIELIEHAAQARYGIRAVIDSTVLYVTHYDDGQLSRRDTLSLVDLGIKQEGYMPAFQLAESPDGEIMAANVVPGSGVYRLGVRNGHILMQINNVGVEAGEREKAESLMWSTRSAPLPITLHNPDTRKSYSIKAPLVKQTRITYNRPYTHADIIIILEKLTNNFLQLHPEFKRKLVKPTNSQTFDLLAPLFDKGACKAYGQIATYDPGTHPISYPTRINPRNTLIGGPIFSNEKFRELTNAKKTYKPGDAALIVMNFYNYTQNRTSLGFTRKVDKDLQSALGYLSGPYYNKPGVFYNYYLAGLEYERSKLYTAALNQYYASLRKVDDLIAGKRTILKAKTAIADRIAYCAGQLGQHNYGKLMAFAARCLSQAQASEEIMASEENFYTFSNEVATTVRTIEDQLAEQRTQRFMAILQAATSVASGVATYSYDAGLSTAYFFDAVETIAVNEDYHQTVNNMIRRSTESMEINLPAELLTDEVNPYEIKATQFIIESLLQGDVDPEVMRLVEEYAKDKEDLREAVQAFKMNLKITGKADARMLVDALIRHEATIYRYEKRGLAVPGKV